MNTHKLLTSSFGLGYLPVAPGTWGSLAPAVIYMTAGILIGPQTAMVSMAVLLVLGCVVTVVCSPKVIAATGSKDPGQIVSDEVAGQALTLLLAQWLMPMTGFCTPTAIGFGLFRLFDITKPWPCRRLEYLPAGWGILADDLAAGIWAAIVWRILIYPLV
jgi:phosphatidylglycerophosphatase A